MREFAIEVLECWVSVLCWIFLLALYGLPLWIILGALGWLALR